MRGINRTVFAKIEAENRLALAKRKTDRLIDHVVYLLQLNAANRTVIYSNILSRQVPHSYAANAFNQFQRSMHLFELVRLASIWDAPRRDRDSIPTILALTYTPDAIELVVEETRNFFLHKGPPHDLNPSSDPEIIAAKDHWWKQYKVERASEFASKARRWLNYAARETEKLLNSDHLGALRKLRDHHIAHNLYVEDEAARPSTVGSLRFGDEKYILDRSTKIANALHLSLNGTSFDWNGSKRIARDNANSLWKNCKFSIKSI